MPPTGFSSATFYKLRAKFGGMEASGAKRLRDMEVGDLLRESSTINDNRVYRLYKLADRPTGRPADLSVRRCASAAASSA